MSTQFTNRQWRLPNNENKDKQSNYSMDKFDQNDYISTPLTIDEFSSATMSIWFKTSLSQNDKYFLTFPEASGSNGFDLNFVTSGIKSYLVCHSGASTLNSTFTYDDGNWHHVIVSYSGTIHKMYIDGVLTDSNSASIGTIKNAEGNLYIGALSSLHPTYRVSQTKLDQVVVFNYALSDGGVSVGQTATGQIATLYGGGSAVSNPMSLSPAPVAYYPLGDQDSFNGADYLVPNSSLKDYVFDFTSSTISIGNLSQVEGNDFSVSLWLNRDSAHSSVIYNSGSAYPNGLIFQSNQNGSFFISVGGGDETTSTMTISDGVWYNAILTVSGTTAKVYVNGLQLGSNLTVGSARTGIGIGTVIGEYNHASGYNFNGKLSNVQVFNTALPETGSNSIETLYNNGSPLTSMSGFTSLQGWWKLDASATYDGTDWTIPDDSSNSNDGTSSGMTQANLIQSDLSFTSGYSPYALDFDGANDYIDFGTGLGNSLGNSYSGDLSISIWFKATSIGTAPGLFSINNGNGVFGPIQIYFYNNRLYFRVQPTQSGFNYISIPFTDTTSWHHLTVVYKSGSQSNSKMYLDGADTSTNSGGSFPTTLDFDGIKTLIGYYYSDSFLFNGSISNVSVWNAGLTSSQVTEIYNEGVPSNLNNHSAYSNLVSWWQLGSNTSWVDPYWIALDEKGTNNGQSQNVAAPNNMGENAIVDGVGSYANGLSDGMGGDEVIGDAPYSSSNSLSVNMDVEDRTTDTPS